MSLFASLLLASATATAPTPATAPAPERQDVPIPEKIPAPDADETAPTVTIRTADNGDVVQEYRQNGRLFMVRVLPKNGRPYYLYDDDGNGRLDRTDGDRRFSPVYWTIYEWD